MANAAAGVVNQRMGILFETTGRSASQCCPRNALRQIDASSAGAFTTGQILCQSFLPA